MLRRTSFRRPTYTPPPPAPLRPATRTGTYAKGSDVGNPISKEQAIQSDAYMRAVRGLGYCVRCLRECRPEVCHRDCGKGMGIKTDCREAWAGCGFCHALLGGHKGGPRYPKEFRRELEMDLARKTRAAVLASGRWPKDLPMWKEDA